MKFYVIGISDNPLPFFPPEVLEVIRNGNVFSGGKRHHEIVRSLLPKDAEWIDITVPLDAVFEQYHNEVVVFASGDPLFFGFANTIRRKMPDAEIVIYPTFNSLQLLANRLVMPYHDMRVVSLTGRPWPEFDRAPASIAQRMIDYGYTNYQMHVGEHLGNPELEKVTTLSLEEASQRDYTMPNCVILDAVSHQTSAIRHPFGIPDSEFTHLDGREKMITKMPIRLLTLQALDLPCRHVLWDIGSCTGSVSIESIEARLQFPHLHIDAFEIRPECEAIINENARRFGAPGITVHMGDFLKTDIASLPRPDAVFIGGHGGKLKEIMKKVLTVMDDDGIIVFNSVVAPKVLTDSQKLWDEACEELDLKQDTPLHIQLNDNHPITILKCSR